MVTLFLYQKYSLPVSEKNGVKIINVDYCSWQFIFSYGILNLQDFLE